MNKFFVMMFVLFALVLTGCATAVPTYLETLGPVGEHFGSVSTTSVNGVETEKKTLEEETVLTPAMAEYKLKLAALQAQLEAAKASASYYRPVSNWYGGGGGVVITGSGGRNYVHNSGGGTSTGGNTGATITTGSGGSNSVSSHPSGSNTSGGNPGGTTITTGSGGTNTTYRH